MRLPELAGFQLETLIGEDPFGWSYMAGHRGPEKRFVRILKAQATHDGLVNGIYERLSQLRDNGSLAKIEVYSPRMVGMPATISTHFPGWQNSQGVWKISSLTHLSHLLDRENSISAIKKIADCLAGLHAEGIYHGSLRPSNIFLTGQGDEPEVKLTGFGEMMIPDLQNLEASELPFYIAPEQLKRESFTYQRAAGWDVYSFGVIAYQLLTRHLPRLDRLYDQFLHRPEQLNRLLLVSMSQLTKTADQIQLHLEAERNIVWPDKAHDAEDGAIRSVIERCLSFQPGNRFGQMGEVADAIRKAVAAVKQPAASPVAAPAQPSKPLQVSARIEPAPVQAPVQESPPPGTLSPAAIAQRQRPRRSRVQAPHTEPIRTLSPAPSAVPEPEPEPELPPEFREQLAESEPAPPEPQPQPQPDPVETSTAQVKPPRYEVGDEGDATGTGPSRTSVDEVEVDSPPLWFPFAESNWISRGIAALLLLGFIILSGTTVFYRYELSKTNQRKDLVLTKMAEAVKKQEEKLKEEIAEKEKSSEELKENLDEVEDTKARLLGEAQLARNLLRQSQENGDRFFKLVLENRDTDVPAFREGRKSALLEGKKHYKRLIDIYGNAPDFMVSKAHAFYYLGRIHKELGEYGPAVTAISEAEKRYLDLTQHSDGNPVFTENLAVAKQAIGDLAMKNASYTVASQVFDSSSRHWQELAELDVSREIDAAIEVNRNSLKIIECHHALGNDEVALKGAETIAEQFLKLQEKFPENERIVGGLGASFEILGRIYEVRRESDNAVRSYQQGATLFAEAVKLNAAIDQYHLGLGSCLARIGLMKNDVDKLEGSVEILTQVIARNPHEPDHLATLAEVFGYLAGNQRDGGRLENAIALEEEAIDFLRPILQDNKVMTPVLQYAYAKRLIHLAELRVDANKFDDSRPPLNEAIQVLDQVIVESKKSPSTYRRSLAKARGLAGFASLKSGDKTSAKKYYEMAKADWKTYMAQNPNDSDAANNARWASDQLQALR